MATLFLESLGWGNSLCNDIVQGHSSRNGVIGQTHTGSYRVGLYNPSHCFVWESLHAVHIFVSRVLWSPPMSNLYYVSYLDILPDMAPAVLIELVYLNLAIRLNDTLHPFLDNAGRLHVFFQ